ncbi:MAG: hypothetical protein FWH57_01075 [Oscillospiraceae bacterium]|nr:hypothetical protein [Oscillospiraceae bacterium]
MKSKLLDNRHVAIGAALIFAAMFVFFAIISPSVPYDSDDWHYLSSFSLTPVPVPPFDTWNPTRILPEYLMPAAGYFSAFVVYPLIGDYILSISVTTALLLSALLTTLYISLYGLFLSLSNDKVNSALAGVFAIALCFALFKGRPKENMHLFIVYSLNLHYFYTIPNILNSILVCQLLRLCVKSELSFRRVPRKAPLLVTLLYFCIFSMLFSAITLLAFSVSVLLLNLLETIINRKRHEMKFLQALKQFGLDSFKRANIAVAAFIGVVYAIIAESFGGRAKWNNGSTLQGSVLNARFISRLFESVKSLFGFVLTMNRHVFVIMLAIFIVAVGIYIHSRKKEQPLPDPYAKAAPTALLSCVVALVCVALVSAKGGTQYSRDIRSAYSVFFFGIVFISILATYLNKKIRVMRVLFPLITIVVVMVAINSRNQFAYTYNRTYTQTQLVESFIQKVVQADLNNETTVELRAPRYSAGGNWPIHVDSWGKEFSNTLYNHRITSSKIEITLQLDDSLPKP